MALADWQKKDNNKFPALETSHKNQSDPLALTNERNNGGTVASHLPSLCQVTFYLFFLMFIGLCIILIVE
jgi:hypothetical protein